MSAAHALTPTDREAAERSARRFGDERLDPDELVAEIDHWRRQRALLLGDLEAHDFTECDEKTLRNGVGFADVRLAQLTRQATRYLRAGNVPGYVSDRPQSDYSARFAAAKHVDLVAIAETLTGQGAVRTGQRYKMLCPLHQERTASFVIFPPSRWRCFGCNRHGDAVDLAVQLNHIPAVEALALIEALSGLQPPRLEATS